MVDIQTTGNIVKWAIDGITILLLILAASMAIKKKNNICLGVVILGNLSAYYFTRSPLICMIISIACIIWASSMKSPEQNKQELESSKSPTTQKKRVKAGNIIGLILGIGLVAGPLIGYLRQEASLSDTTTQGVLILFAVIGGFMIINNIFELLKKDETIAPAATVTTTQQPPKEKTKAEDKSNKNKVRCRFCKKLYSSEYNGCPYCKKK